MTIRQLSIFIENRTGKMLEALETLAGANIDLRALSLADTSDFGILRIIVDDSDYALETLRTAGFLVKSNDVLAVVVGDKPGGLASVVRILADFGIGIEYSYAFIGHARDRAYVILRVDKNEGAISALEANDVTLLSANDVRSM